MYVKICVYIYTLYLLYIYIFFCVPYVTAWYIRSGYWLRCWLLAHKTHEKNAHKNACARNRRTFAGGGVAGSATAAGAAAAVEGGAAAAAGVGVTVGGAAVAVCVEACRVCGYTRHAQTHAIAGDAQTPRGDGAVARRQAPPHDYRHSYTVNHRRLDAPLRI